MQIEEKYKGDYALALEKFREERARFVGRLQEIKGLRVVPSQANFLMVETSEEISPKELLKVLMVRYNLLIKDLTEKTHGKNYLRIAVRNTEDNDVLIDALTRELGVK